MADRLVGAKRLPGVAGVISALRCYGMEVPQVSVGVLTGKVVHRDGRMNGLASPPLGR